MQKIRLGDVLNVKRGMSLPGEYYATEGKYKRLTLGNFEYPGGGFKDNNSKADIYYVGEVRDEFILKKGDIITPLTEQVPGLLGCTAFIPANETYIQSGDVGLVLPDETKIDKNYVYYLLSSQIIKKQLASSAQQTKIRHTTPSAIMNCIAWIPELHVQRHIGTLLRSIDLVIETNKRINDNLAEQLQLIYQQLIEDSKSTAISCTLRDISQFATGKRPVPSISVDTYYSTENMLPNKKGATVATSLPQMEQVTACNPGDTLVSNIRPYFKKIVYCSSTAGCSADVLCLTPKRPEYSAFLYSLIYDDHFFDYVVSGSKGTKMPRGDKNQIMAYPVKLPDSNLLSRFNAAAMPILERQEKSRQEIQALTSLRDYLLPLLLNGQITIGG